MGSINIYDKDEKQIDLDRFGLLGLKLTVPSPSYSYETEEIEGIDGVRVISQKLLPRNLNAIFWSKSRDYQQSLQKRNEIYSFLGNGEEYYVEESENAGRRWKVRIGSWDPNRINTKIQEFSIPLVANSGKSETVITNSKIFNTPSFQFKNEGNLKIDMSKQMETEIEFKGASDSLTLTNKTTGEVWKYNGSTVAGDTILIKGVRSLKNGSSIFGQTNKKMISFVSGWNDFEISGATIFSLTIRTRFYFL